MSQDGNNKRGLKLSDGRVLEPINDQEYNDILQLDPQAKEMESYVSSNGDTLDFTVDEQDAIQEFLALDPQAKPLYSQKKSSNGTTGKGGATPGASSKKPGENNSTAARAGYSTGLLNSTINIFDRQDKWNDKDYQSRYYDALLKQSGDPAEIDALKQRVEQVAVKNKKYKNSLAEAKADSLKQTPSETTTPAGQKAIQQQANTAAADIKKEQEKRLGYFNREVNGALASIPLPPDFGMKMNALSKNINEVQMQTLSKLEPEAFKQAMGMVQQDLQKGGGEEEAYKKHIVPLMNLYGEQLDNATKTLEKDFLKLDEVKRASVFNDNITLTLARKMYHDYNRDKVIDKDYAMYQKNFRAISKAGTTPLSKEDFSINNTDPSVRVSKAESLPFDQNVAKYNYLRSTPGGGANDDLLGVQKRQLQYDVDALTFMNEQATNLISNKKSSPAEVYKAQLVSNGIKKTMSVLSNIYPEVVKRKADQKSMQLKTDLRSPMATVSYPGGEIGMAISNNVARGLTDYIANSATAILDQPGMPDMFTRWSESIADAQFRINEGWFGIPSNMQAPLIDRYTMIDVGGKKLRFYAKGDEVADVRSENGFPIEKWPMMLTSPQEFYDKNKTTGKAVVDFRGDLILPKLARTGTDMFTLLYGANKFGKLLKTQKGGLVLSGYLTEYENAYSDFKSNNPLINDGDAKLYAGVRSAFVSSLELINPQSYLFKESVLNKLKGDYIDLLSKGVDRYTAIKLAAKDIGKEGLGEVLQEYMQEFGGMGVDYMTNLALGQEAVEIDFNPDEFIETGILTFATAGIFKGFTDIRSKSDIEIDALYTSVGNYDKLLDHIEMQAARGDISPEQKDRVTQVLGDLKLAYDQVPQEVDDATKAKLFKLIAAKNNLLKNSEGLVQSPEVQEQLQSELTDIDNLIDYTYKIKVPRYIVDGKPIGRAEILNMLDSSNDYFQNIIDGKLSVEVFNDPAIEAKFKSAYDELNAQKRRKAEAEAQAQKEQADKQKADFDAQQKLLPPGKTTKPVAIQDQNKPKGDKPTVKGENAQSVKLAEQKTEIENSIQATNNQLVELQKQEVKDQELIDALTLDLQTKKQELEAVEVNLVDQTKLEAGDVNDVSEGLQEDGVTWVTEGKPLRWITNNFDENGSLMSSDFLDEEGNHVKINDENMLFDMAISMSNFWQNKMAETMFGKPTAEMVDARSRAARKLRPDQSSNTSLNEEENVDGKRKQKAEKVEGEAFEKDLIDTISSEGDNGDTATKGDPGMPEGNKVPIYTVQPLYTGLVNEIPGNISDAFNLEGPTVSGRAVQMVVAAAKQLGIKVPQAGVKGRYTSKTMEGVLGELASKGINTGQELYDAVRSMPPRISGYMESEMDASHGSSTFLFDVAQHKNTIRAYREYLDQLLQQTKGNVWDAGMNDIMAITEAPNDVIDMALARMDANKPFLTETEAQEAFDAVDKMINEIEAIETTAAKDKADVLEYLYSFLNEIVSLTPVELLPIGEDTYDKGVEKPKKDEQTDDEGAEPDGQDQGKPSGPKGSSRPGDEGKRSAEQQRVRTAIENLQEEFSKPLQALFPGEKREGFISDLAENLDKSDQEIIQAVTSSLGAMTKTIAAKRLPPVIAKIKEELDKLPPPPPDKIKIVQGFDKNHIREFLEGKYDFIKDKKPIDLKDILGKNFDNIIDAFPDAKLSTHIDESDNLYEYIYFKDTDNNEFVISLNTGELFASNEAAVDDFTKWLLKTIKNFLGLDDDDDINQNLRNPVSTAPVGAPTSIKFADNVYVTASYSLTEAKTGQGSHLISGTRNPRHYISKGQPKERDDVFSKAAQDNIIYNTNLPEITENTNAYSGAPVVNQYDEVIQGNNRFIALERLYQVFPEGSTYKQYLIDNAEKFGFTKDQVLAMDQPILTRKMNVSDINAIIYGNYDVKDLETGDTSRKMNPVAVINRMSLNDKVRLADMLLSIDYPTINKAIRLNADKVFNLLKLYVQPALLNNLTKKTDRNELSSEGVNSIEQLVKELLFDNGISDLKNIFDGLPYTIQKNLENALASVYDVPSGKSLLPSMQNAIVATADFLSYDVDWNTWKHSIDMFKNARPADVYTELELAIAKTLVEAKKQDGLKALTKLYASKVNDAPGDFFIEPTPGLSIEKAVKETFNVDAHEKDIKGIVEAGNKKDLPEEGPGNQAELPQSDFPHKKNVVPANLIERGKLETFAFNNQPGVVPGDGKYSYDPSKPYPETSLAYNALKAGFSETTGMALASKITPSDIEMLKLDFDEVVLKKLTTKEGEMLVFYDKNGLFFNPFKLKTMRQTGAATDQDRSMLEQHENFELHENVKLAQIDGDAIAYKVLSTAVGRKLVDNEFQRSTVVAKKLGDWRFYGGHEKVNTAADVANIFRSLENESVEHFFVLMQNAQGKQIVVHAGTGNTLMTPVDIKKIFNVATQFGAVKLWHVHNHPSGQLNYSRADIKIDVSLRSLAENTGISIEDGIIIDLNSGQFTTYRGYYNRGSLIDESINDYKLLSIPIVENFSAGSNLINYGPEIVDAKEISTYSVSPRVFSDAGLKNSPTISNIEDAAAFVMGLHAGGGPKFGFVLMSNKREVVGVVYGKNMVDPAVRMAIASNPEVVKVIPVTNYLPLADMNMLKAVSNYYTPLAKTDDFVFVQGANVNVLNTTNPTGHPPINASNPGDHEPKALLSQALKNGFKTYEEVLFYAFTELGSADALKEIALDLGMEYIDNYFDLGFTLQSEYTSPEAVEQTDIDGLIKSWTVNTKTAEVGQDKSPEEIKQQERAQSLRQLYSDFADWFEFKYPRMAWQYELHLGEEGPEIRYGGKVIHTYNEWAASDSAAAWYRQHKKDILTRPPMVWVDQDSLMTPENIISKDKYALGEDQTFAVNMILQRFLGKDGNTQQKSLPVVWGTPWIPSIDAGAFAMPEHVKMENVEKFEEIFDTPGWNKSVSKWSWYFEVKSAMREIHKDIEYSRAQSPKSEKEFLVSIGEQIKNYNLRRIEEIKKLPVDGRRKAGGHTTIERLKIVNSVADRFIKFVNDGSVSYDPPFTSGLYQSKAFVLADGPGVGKTRTELIAALEMANRTGKPAMIFTLNKNIIPQFKKEAEALGIKPEEISYGKENPKDIGVKIYVGHYTDMTTKKLGLRKPEMVDGLEERPYSMIIFDESHALKNLDKSARAAVGFKFSATLANNTVFSTATPNDKITTVLYWMAPLIDARPGRPIEDKIKEVASSIGIEVQVNSNSKTGDIDLSMKLNKGVTWPMVKDRIKWRRRQFMNEGAFLRREFPYFGTIEETDISPASIPELPEFYEGQEDIKENIKNGMSRVMQQQRFAPLYKAEAVVNQAKFSLNQGRQVAIVIPFWNSLSVTGVYGDPETRHPSLSEELISQFEKLGIKRDEIALIYGKNPIEQNVKDFQSGKKRVAIFTVETGGTGIDLDDQFGDARRDAFIISPPWAGDAMDQLIFRFSRRNTKSPTRMLLFWIQGAYADEKKRDVWTKKREIVRTIQAGEDPSDVEAALWDQDLEFGQGEITEPIDPETDIDPNVARSPVERYDDKTPFSSLEKKDVVSAIASGAMEEMYMNGSIDPMEVLQAIEKYKLPLPRFILNERESVADEMGFYTDEEIGEQLQLVNNALDRAGIPVISEEDYKNALSGTEIEAMKGLGLGENVENGISAFHYSPYLFEKFNEGKIGKGVGKQYQGHGFYFYDKEIQSSGYGKNEYQVKIHSDKNPSEYDYLTDKTISDSQRNKITDAINNLPESKLKSDLSNYINSEKSKTDSGLQLYFKVSDIFDSNKTVTDKIINLKNIFSLRGYDSSQEKASKFLLSSGIDGIHENSVYIVFDPEAITIEKVNKKAVENKGTPFSDEEIVDNNFAESPSRFGSLDNISDLDVAPNPGKKIPKWKQWLFGKVGTFNFGQEMLDAMRRAGVPRANISHLKKRYLGMYYGMSESIRLQTSLNAFTAIHEGMHWATLSNISRNANGDTMVDDILNNGTAQDMNELKAIVQLYYGNPGPILKSKRNTVAEGLACIMERSLNTSDIWNYQITHKVLTAGAQFNNAQINALQDEFLKVLGRYESLDPAGKLMTNVMFERRDQYAEGAPGFDRPFKWGWIHKKIIQPFFDEAAFAEKLDRAYGQDVLKNPASNAEYSIYNMYYLWRQRMNQAAAVIGGHESTLLSNAVGAQAVRYASGNNFSPIKYTIKQMMEEVDKIGEKSKDTANTGKGYDALREHNRPVNYEFSNYLVARRFYAQYQEFKATEISYEETAEEMRNIREAIKFLADTDPARRRYIDLYRQARKQLFKDAFNMIEINDRMNNEGGSTRDFDPDWKPALARLNTIWNIKKILDNDFDRHILDAKTGFGPKKVVLSYDPDKGKTPRTEAFTTDIYEAFKDVFAKPEEMYDAINRDMVLMAVSTGRLDPEVAKKYINNFGYARFMRFVESEVYEDGESIFNQHPNAPGLNIGSFLKYGGSAKTIVDPIVGQMFFVQEIFKKGYENKIWNNLATMARNNPDSYISRNFRQVEGSIVTEIDPVTGKKLIKRVFPTQPQLKNTIEFYRNGKKVMYEITDPAIMTFYNNVMNNQWEAADKAGSFYNTWLYKIPLAAAKWFQYSTTAIYPIWPILNYTVDLITRIQNSKAKMVGGLGKKALNTPVVGDVKNLTLMGAEISKAQVLKYKKLRELGHSPMATAGSMAVESIMMGVVDATGEAMTMRNVVYDHLKKKLGRDPELSDFTELNQYLSLMGANQTFLGSISDADPISILEKAIGVRKDSGFLKKAQYTIVEEAGPAIGELLKIGTDITEIAGRLNEFIKAKSMGKSDVTSMRMTGEVSTNFLRRGSSVQFNRFVALIAYKRALINATGTWFKNMGTEKGRARTAYTLGGLTTATIAYWIYAWGLMDDEEKKMALNFDPRSLSQNLLIPKKIIPFYSDNAKGFIQLRIPDQVGAFTGTVALGTISYLSNANISKERYADIMAKIIPDEYNPYTIATTKSPYGSGAGGVIKTGFSWMPTLGSTLLQSALNLRTYPFVGSITPQHMNNLPSYMRYDDLTPPQAIDLSKRLSESYGAQISPKQIEFLFRGLMGRGVYSMGELALTGDYEKFNVMNMARKELIFRGESFNQFYNKAVDISQHYKAIANPKNDAMLSQNPSKLELELWQRDVTKVIVKHKINEDLKDLLSLVYNTNMQISILQLDTEFPMDISVKVYNAVEAANKLELTGIEKNDARKVESLFEQITSTKKELSEFIMDGKNDKLANKLKTVHDPNKIMIEDATLKTVEAMEFTVLEKELKILYNINKNL